MPEITIITPAYLDSREKITWLNEAIQSVQAQDFADWEMNIVDDSSPLQFEPPGDPRVRYVRASKRQRPAMCRNTAVALARAECLLPLDADDKLAGPSTLSSLYEVWRQQPNTVVYGDMQYLTNGQLGKVIQFPQYSFKKVLDPRGMIPVTAMHSRDCHQAAGGWKAVFEHGLEDVEYWIAAGAAGFCGVKLDEVVLLYRRGHEDSRTRIMRSAGLQGEAQNLIRQMHVSLYEGRYPVGCCGGGRTTKALAPVSRPGLNRAPTPLAAQQFAHDTVWVRYNGRREGAFGMRGQATGQIYTVNGRGAEFEIYAIDANVFRRSGRGRDFSVGIAPPAPEPEPEPEPQPQPEPFQAPPPALAEIERLDAVATAERGIAREPEPLQPATPIPEPVQSPPPLVESKSTWAEQLQAVAEAQGDEPETMPEQAAPATHTPLDVLELGKFEEILDSEGWTVEKLAGADPLELTPYPGIGSVTATKIVDQAKAHLVGHG